MSLVENVIRPHLGELEVETNQRIVAIVRVKFEGVWGIKLDCPGFDSVESSSAQAEIRVLLSQAFAAGRYLFKLESIIHGLAPKTGYSGFSIHGDIKVKDELITCGAEFITHRYNRWQWGTKFTSETD